MVFDTLNPEILEFICEDFKNGMFILDVGCATGRLIKELKSHFAGVIAYGIEIDKDSLRIAEKYFDKIFNINLEDIIRNTVKFESDVKFDYIVFGDILEHVSNSEAIIKTFKRFLKRDGMIIISLPNVVNWRIRIKFLFGNFDSDGGILDSSHLRFFTYNSAKKIIQDCGLTMLSVRNNNSNKIIRILGRIWKSFFAFQLVFKCKLNNGKF